MSMVEKLGLAFLHRLDPERAHDLSIRALATRRYGKIILHARKIVDASNLLPFPLLWWWLL